MEHAVRLCVCVFACKCVHVCVFSKCVQVCKVTENTCGWKDFTLGLPAQNA